MSYSEKFISSEAVESYDNDEYSQLSVSNLLWQIEQEILFEIVSNLASKLELRYLDFACGTGRITSFIEPFVASSTGIDISSEMISRACKRTVKTKFFCKDITKENMIEASYNLITSFRFLSNVDSNLRVLILLSLRQRMEPEAILIVNTHTNPFSYKIFFIILNYARKLFGMSIHTKYLSKRRFQKILDDAGFDVIQVIGYGFMPGKILRFIPWKYSLMFEKFIFKIKFFRHFGVNQIAVCRRSFDE